MNNNYNNEGWSGIFLGTFGAFFICGSIGVFLAPFSDVLFVIMSLVLPLAVFLYLVYDTFGTEEKRKKQKRIAKEVEKQRKKQFYNEDGTRKSRKQMAQEAAEKKLQTINSYGVYPTKIISNDYGYSTVYIDDNNERIYVEALYNNYVFDYKDILDFELVVDDMEQLRYGVSTAITGTFQSKKVVSSIMVKIYINNIETPIIEVRSLGDGTKYNVDSMKAYCGRKFADELIGVLTYIKNKQK